MSESNQRSLEELEAACLDLFGELEVADTFFVPTPPDVLMVKISANLYTYHNEGGKISIQFGAGPRKKIRLVEKGNKVYFHMRR